MFKNKRLSYDWGRWKTVLPAGNARKFSQDEFMKKRPRTSLSPLQRKRLVIIGVCLAFIAFLWIIFAPHMGVYSLMQQRSKLARLQVENAEIGEKSTLLEKEIEQIKNDPEYFEKVARDKHGLLKDNEMVFDFTPSKKEKKK
jgi:cell division protein FtsB